jgi:hypothetical protein
MFMARHRGIQREDGMTNLEKAMRAVRRGPEVKRLKVEGHHWNFKRAKREGTDRKNGTGVVKGRISHNVRFVDDDQIDYEITYLGRDAHGKPKKPMIEIKIKRAAWKQIAPKAVAAGVAYFSKNTSATATVDALSKEIFKNLHGDWEKVAEGLVAVIAAEMGKSLYPLGRRGLGSAGGVQRN